VPHLAMPAGEVRVCRSSGTTAVSLKGIISERHVLLGMATGDRNCHH
jgi:hypothetical protein